MEIQAKPGEEVCDFCVSTEVTWTYDAEDFMYPQITLELPGFGTIIPLQGSTGAWATCDTCHDYIEAGDIPSLQAHGDKRFYEENSEWLDLLSKQDRMSIRKQRLKIFKLFLKHRTGPAIPAREWLDSSRGS